MHAHAFMTNVDRTYRNVIAIIVMQETVGSTLHNKLDANARYSIGSSALRVLVLVQHQQPDQQTRILNINKSNNDLHQSKAASSLTQQAQLTTSEQQAAK